MDKIGDFLFFGGDFLTSRTRLTGRTFLGVGIKIDPTLVVESLGLWALTDSFFATLRKRLRDDELGGSNFSHRFNEIKQKIIRVIRAIRG